MKLVHGRPSAALGQLRFAALATLFVAMSPAVAGAQTPATPTAPGAPSDSPTAAPTPASPGAVAPSPAAPSSPAPGAASAEATPTGSAATNPSGTATTTESARTASPDAAAKNADLEAQAAAAAIAAQASSPGTSEAVADELKTVVYGFADFAYMHQLNDFSFGPLPKGSFGVGNLNLYIGSELGDNWRSLVEVRFMYLPNGVETYSPTGEVTRTDTTVGEYNDLGHPIQWGGVSIQRAYIERTIDPLLTIRAGHFLTPYGIWNVDHGSPVIIGVRKPYVAADNLLPQSQSGLEIYGSLFVGSNKFGYHLTLSNGRGPLDTYKDLNGNKAIGGRLFWRNDSSIGTITVGTSAYKGKFTNSGSAFQMAPDGSYKTVYPLVNEYDEFSLAGDVKFESGGLLVQSEIIMNEVAYNDEARPAIAPGMGRAGAPTGFTPDNRRWGLYAMAGYRFPFLGTMPFFGYEYTRPGEHQYTPRANAVWGGLNVRPTARVVLKAQYTQSWFPDLTMDGFKGLDFQVAWSF